MTDDLELRVTRVEARVAEIDERGTRGLAKVEAVIARNDQRITDLDTRVSSLLPMITVVATLSERVETLRFDFADFRHRIDERDEETREERRSVKLAIWGMTMALVCALITAGTVVVTSIH